MKLPICLFVVVVLCHTANTSAKSSARKASGTVPKQKGEDQTYKRELYEGNFGDRKDILSKYAASDSYAGIVYADDSLKDMLQKQSPAHQIFGARLPHIAKISDVLTGQGPGSFEAAVAKHLYSPVSVYQLKHPAPSSFEVPEPAASQLPFPKAYQSQKPAEKSTKSEKLKLKGMAELKANFDNLPLFAVKQPSIETFPQPLAPEFSQQPLNIQHDIFRQQQQLPRRPVAQLFPLYDHLGPIRYQGHVVPSQYLQQRGIYQFVPVDTGIDYEDSRGDKESNEASREELKGEPLERPNVQSEIPLPKHGYHAHPNGAISFASYTQNLQANPPPSEAAQQSQSTISYQEQPEKLPAQLESLIAQAETEDQKFASAKQNHLFPLIYNNNVQEPQKYDPKYYRPEPQYITFQQPILNQPEAILNALHLISQNSKLMHNPPTIQIQRLPAFKPLPESLLTPGSFAPPTTASPPVAQETYPLFKRITEPRPFDYVDQSTPRAIHVDQPIAPVSPQRQYTPLPPLKPNYSKHVQPLSPQTQTSPVFLPTPLQPLPTTPKAQLALDQVVSSTTIQPDIKEHQEPKEQSTQAATVTEQQSQTLQPVELEITHQSHPTEQPPSVRSTKQQPFAYIAQLEQYSTPQPQYQYQSTVYPETKKSSPRHDVVIQKQEIQELIFAPSHPSSTPHYQQQEQHIQNQNQERPQVQSQQNEYSLKHIIEPQQLLSQQYQLESQQLKSLQEQHAALQLKLQEYQNQHLQSKLSQQQFQPVTSQQQSPILKPQQPEEQQGSEKTQSEKHHSESENEPQESTLRPTKEPEKRTEKVDLTRQLEPLLHLQDEPGIGEGLEQYTTPEPTPDQPLMGPVLSPIHAVLPLYAQQPQQLLAQPQYTAPSNALKYPDVQYFGKFAETIFGSPQR